MGQTRPGATDRAACLGRHAAPAYHTSVFIAESRQCGGSNGAFDLLVQQLRNNIGQLRRKFTSFTARDGGWHKLQMKPFSGWCAWVINAPPQQLQAESCSMPLSTKRTSVRHGSAPAAAHRRPAGALLQIEAIGFNHRFHPAALPAFHQKQVGVVKHRRVNILFPCHKPVG